MSSKNTPVFNVDYKSNMDKKIKFMRLAHEDCLHRMMNCFTSDGLWRKRSV